MTDEKREYFCRRREDSRKAYEALMNYYPFTLDNLDGEIWREIYPGYQVSNFGRVKSFKFKSLRIMRPLIARMYLCFNLRVDGVYKYISAHRLVAEAFVPNPDNKPQVNHIDGNKFNNHVSNLEWVTASENVQHAYDTGLYPSCESRYNSKLTNEQVLFIRNNTDQLSRKQLSILFNVTEAVIGSVQLGVHYKNIGGTIRPRIKQRVPYHIRQQIRSEFIKGDKRFGASALSRKYRVDRKTISRILKEP